MVQGLVFLGLIGVYWVTIGLYYPCNGESYGKETGK